MALRLINGAKQITNKFKFPEKLKGGRTERIANYFHVIYSDYKTVFQEVLEDMVKKPIKSGVYLTLLAGGVVLFKTNPNEHSFKTLTVQNSNDLALVGDAIRNSVSENYMQNLARFYKDGRLNYVNLGLFSIVYLTDHNKKLGLYSAQCKHVKPHWTKFHKSVQDIGLFGKWIYSEKAMTDYDINENEWK